MEGKIFDIKRFAIHDGPGIRTTVFTKGCPLDCLWCHNPEGKSERIRLWYIQNRCIGCNQCIKTCPENALTIDKTDIPINDKDKKKNIIKNNYSKAHISIDRKKCNLCGQCVEICPAKALTFDGQIMSTKEIVKEVKRDSIFYKNSGGGVTISGGDPFNKQYLFNIDILKKCKEEGIHTAIETCLYGDEKILDLFIPWVDLFIVDLKIFDTDLHKKYTGVYNYKIKKNFKLLAGKDTKILLRIPLIPGYTACKTNIKKIASFVNEIKRNIPVELINFNPLSRNKYLAGDMCYRLDLNMQPYNDNQLKEFRKIIIETEAG